MANQLQEHMSSNGLSPLLQSAYPKNHSTETACLKVKNDLLMNMSKGHVSFLILLDLSAAFVTVDDEILMYRLQTEFGLGDAVLSWFVSYVTHRSQRVLVNGVMSDAFDLSSGVPQGSCLGPLLFLFYASKIFDVIRSHLPSVHAYADDTQLYLSFSANIIDDQLCLCYNGTLHQRH